MMVDDFIRLLVDPCFFHIQIWDLAKDDVVFDGMAEEIPEKYEYCDIISIDCPVVADKNDAYVCINVSTDND